jgi:hypothetical protein
MFGSQALETLIGIALLMFIISLAASTIVEGISALINKRGRELRKALARLLDPPTAAGGASSPADADGGGTPMAAIRNTVAFSSLETSSKRFPSYIPDDTFVDAVTELVQQGATPPAVEQRLTTVAMQSGDDRDAMEQSLLRYYDAAMSRVSGTYKRWSMLWLFLVGLTIAVAGNVSVYHAAQSLWNDPTTRQAVVAAAHDVGNRDDGLDASELNSVGATVEQLEGTGLPVGWNDQAKAEWGLSFSWGRLGIVFGWLLTAALVMLGANFWFDLLGRLIALRGTGTKPAPDQASGDTARSRVTPTALVALESSSEGAAAAPPPGGQGEIRVDASRTPADVIGSAFGAGS